MRRLKDSIQKPHGQVLLATLFFCFLFIVLFAGLYKAGMAYNYKERARRSADLTLLSAGAVYANGLRLVQYSNVVLMLSYLFDIGVIAAEIAGFIAAFPESIPLAIAKGREADPNTRKLVHRVQSFLFGIPPPPEDGPGGGETGAPETPRGFRISVYAALIDLQGHATAADNRLDNSPWSPVFFFNLENCGGSLAKTMVPGMSLRFRTAAGLFPEEDGEALYSLESGGREYFFTRQQVEPARNPRNPGQMRVRCDSTGPYRCRYVRLESGSGSDESGHVGGGFAASVWRHLLHGLLDKLVLDVTHETDPPLHTLAMWSRMPDKKGGRAYNELNEVTLEGGGLAAWDVLDPPFRTYLKKPDLKAFPYLGRIAGGLSSVQGELSGALGSLGGLLNGL